MARAGAVVAGTLALLDEHIEPGVTTGRARRIWPRSSSARSGGVPTFKGYKGYPAATCLSPNGMVVHGIPGAGAARGGRHPVGRRRSHARRVRRRLGLDVPGRRDLARDAAAARRLPRRSRGRDRAGTSRRTRSSDISRAVQTVTEEAGFSVIRSLVGHGVGRSMHEEPQVPNFVSRHRGPELREGMTIAIEPMITVGAPEVYIHDDEWSISTSDGSLAAHFEHTVAVTAEGPRILTRAAGVLVR